MVFFFWKNQEPAGPVSLPLSLGFSFFFLLLIPRPRSPPPPPPSPSPSLSPSSPSPLSALRPTCPPSTRLCPLFLLHHLPRSRLFDGVLGNHSRLCTQYVPLRLRDDGDKMLWTLVLLFRSFLAARGLSLLRVFLSLSLPLSLYLSSFRVSLLFLSLFLLTFSFSASA